MSIAPPRAGHFIFRYIFGSDVVAANRIDLFAAKTPPARRAATQAAAPAFGVGFDLSKGGGVTFNIAASQGRGNAVGNINTHITAGNTLTLQSESDTNLKGATASGKQVVADIGGDLNIESLQDTSTGSVRISVCEVG